MKLWIDDLRDAPSGDWVIARSSAEAIEILNQELVAGRTVDFISYDHDLGGEDTSRVVVLWQLENDWLSFDWNIHSANPVGQEWLHSVLTARTAERIWYHLFS